MFLEIVMYISRCIRTRTHARACVCVCARVVKKALSRSTYSSNTRKKVIFVTLLCLLIVTFLKILNPQKCGNSYGIWVAFFRSIMKPISLDVTKKKLKAIFLYVACSVLCYCVYKMITTKSNVNLQAQCYFHDGYKFTYWNTQDQVKDIDQLHTSHDKSIEEDENLIGNHLINTHLFISQSIKLR